jgi:hypothetical protein
LEEKLRAIREAALWSAPTADIDTMNQEIERGRLGESPLILVDSNDET